MVSEHKLYFRALVSVAMISILVGIVGAGPFAGSVAKNLF